MRVAAEASDFEVAKPGIDCVASFPGDYPSGLF